MTTALLKVAEVAGILRIHPRSVTDLIASRQLPAINIGGSKAHGARWRIAQRDLDQFLASRRIT